FPPASGGEGEPLGGRLWSATAAARQGTVDVHHLWRSGADRGKRVPVRPRWPTPHRADRDLRPRARKGQSALVLPPYAAGLARQPSQPRRGTGTAAVNRICAALAVCGSFEYSIQAEYPSAFV